MRLNITRLTKSFNTAMVLDDISLSCSTGEIIGIFGRNGSGKSTLLKILFGSLKPDHIHREINGKLFSQKKSISSKTIAYLPQESFLPKAKKVRDIIPLFFADGNIQDQIFYAPKISSFENRKVGNLSLGQLRYLELLLIGNLEHPFLLLDEPFSMIEPIFKDIISSFLIELSIKKGIVITDHYYEDVLKITHRNLLLKNGHLHSITNKSDLILNGYLTN
ncbi:ATP-binding cassette domain-containing protein [Tenacibaculum agarivorans]|uniref:ATP-binding cassette domain-containing protein n=1 Tax=Tenacibaculum agarivorans TaxID=1908389 RepID=UPI00094BA2F7|nr:ATP-binding cassette domain-containing protein [Tenacibaculum agarivorans]